MAKELSEKNIKKLNKNKKKLKKIQKIAVFLIFFIIFIASFSIKLVIYFGKTSVKLETPIINIYARPQSTSIVVNQVSYAENYEYIITYNSQSVTSIIKKDNELELKSYLNQAGKYFIKVRALGKVKRANSDFSEEKIIVNFNKLETPQVSQYNNQIFWQPVKDALGYYVYYSNNNQDELLKNIYLPQSEDTLIFDVAENLNEEIAGKYNIWVVAKGSEENYLQNSNFSNPIVFEKYQFLNSPIFASYDQEQKILKFKIDKNLSIPDIAKLSISYAKTSLQEAEEIQYTDIDLNQIKHNNFEYCLDLSNFINKKIQNIKICLQSLNSYVISSQNFTCELI